MASLSLHCCTQAFSNCGGCSYPLVAGHGLLTTVPSLVKHRLQGVQASAVMALRLSCPMACGIFLDQGLNLCPLHRQVDSFPLDHQGSPTTI